MSTIVNGPVTVNSFELCRAYPTPSRQWWYQQTLITGYRNCLDLLIVLPCCYSAPQHLWNFAQSFEQAAAACAVLGKAGKSKIQWHLIAYQISVIHTKFLFSTKFYRIAYREKTLVAESSAKITHHDRGFGRLVGL